MFKVERSIYTPADFLHWREGGLLEVTPKFQRRGVWKAAARSAFIDTMLRDMPVPPLYLRVIQSPEKNRMLREVVDGQQRISAVLDFLDGKYRLAKAVGNGWAGSSFDELPTEQRRQLLAFSFSTEVFHGVSDFEVLEIFARLNTYSVALNAQELRNGKYFGYFKQTAYRLAYEHLEFWRRQRIFTERSIARMLEVEFVSEVLIAQIDGMQDKKKSIDSFYERFDESFPNQRQVERRFRETADEINEALEDQLSDTEFRRSPLLYTLFCVVYHRLHGLPGESVATPKRGLNKDERLALAEAVVALSEKVVAAKNREPVPKTYVPFAAASMTQTDNIRPRKERFKTLYVRAFS